MQKHMPKRKLMFLALAILSLITGTVLSLAWIAKAGESDSELVKSVKIAPANHFSPTQESRDLTALVFAVRPTGSDPDELTISSGRYLIVVQNRSRLRDLTFRLERENGERLHEVRPQGLNWKRQFDLHPGKYVLSEASHPEWHCVIHVIAR